MQKGAPSQATRVPGGVIWSTVTTYGVAAGIAEIGIVDSKLCMVEQIEGLNAKFKIAAFGYFEVLQRCHIKVQTTGIVHEIAPRVSEGESHGGDKGGGIAYGRANALRIVGPYRRGCVRVANHVRIRSGARPIGDSGVVENRDAIGAGAVNHTERRTRLKSRDARKFPSVSNDSGVSSSRVRDCGAVAGCVTAAPLLQRAAQIWQFVHIANVEQMPLVEVGTRPVRGEIEGVHECGIRPV